MAFVKRNCWMRWQIFYFIIPSWDVISGQIRYSIPEKLSPGAFVGNIANDLGLDAKQLSARGFRIISSAEKQYLDVNLNKGILYVNNNIDREQLCGSSITCILTLQGVIQNPLNMYRVEVEILDVNDNAPSFPQRQFRLEISELAAPGSRFPLERAHDPDIGTNSLQSYQLVPEGHFILDVQTRSGDGKLPMLLLQDLLDREKQATHKLVLIVKDGGVPQRTGTADIMVIVKDVNDNVPTFTQSVYRVRLLENAPIATLLIKLNASDLDEGSNGEILYSFSGHTSIRVRELFSMDSKQGEIRVKANLNYEESTVYEINVQAVDRGPVAVPAYCDVLVEIVDVNDNAPEVIITSLSSPVREDAPTGTVIALIAVTDADSGEYGEHRCYVANNVPFKLESSFDNYYRLVTDQLLDREAVTEYNVTILCSDAGARPLSAYKYIMVQISDINDNAPRFTQSLYTTYVAENNIIGTSICSVTAQDVDQSARLSYSILETLVKGSPVSNYVDINSEDGIIFSKRSYDYEQLKTFQIRVQVQDTGSPPLKDNVTVDVIILDQNDNTPVILSPQPEFGSTVVETIPGSAESGYLVTKVTAIDADAGQNARLSYQLLQSTNPDLFTIEPDTGEIWTIRSINSKDSNKQRLVILVKDNGKPSLSATMALLLTMMDIVTERLSDVSGLSEDPAFDLSLYLIISLAATSSVFFVVVIILAAKVYRHEIECSRHNCTYCCFEQSSHLDGLQKDNRNLRIPANYVEVFGGDPLSQRFRYESYSTLGSTNRDFIFVKTSSLGTNQNVVKVENCATEANVKTANSVKRSSEVRHILLIRQI
ncbi:protocadherin gamma-C5-like [Heterodontus francisci]|uniref:protocadherin gamma-C5-like n=1 Tax=Heterodontus francisci TaxID=7792 RepID=UPI00355C9D2B